MLTGKELDMQCCRRRKFSTRNCLLLLLMALTTATYAKADTSGAKALFFDEGDVTVTAESKKSVTKKRKKVAAAPSAPTHLGLSYWIDLIDENGRATRTTTSRVFAAGDRIKLNVQSNRKGYLYVIGLGSSGNSQVLFPNSEGVANGIKAKVTYSVPFNTNLKFDSTPGEETLLLVLSEKPVPEMIPGRRLLPAQETRQLLASAETGSKDLVLEEVDHPGMQPATYAVVPAAVLGGKGILSVQIKLKHR